MVSVTAVSFTKYAHCNASHRPFDSLNRQLGSRNRIQDRLSRLNLSLRKITAGRHSCLRFSAQAGAKLSGRGRIGNDGEFSSQNWGLRRLLPVPRRDCQSRSLSVGWRVQVRLDPGGGGDGEEENGVVRTIVNLALAGGLTYLTVTGRLGWVFDAIISIWLVAVILPVVGLVAFLWFAEREIVRGACPNCGNEFQVFEFTAKEGDQRCPYCSQPFKVENKQFIREGPNFAERQQYGGFNPFDFGQPKAEARRKDVSGDSSGIIVDVEAEVRDKD